MTDKVRPSQMEALESSLRKSSVWSFKDLCSMSEFRLRRFPGITGETVKDIKCYLGDYGLKLGMTEKELNEYLDADYFEKYPNKKYVAMVSADDDICIEEPWSIEQEEAKSREDVLNDTDLLNKIAEETTAQTDSKDTASAKNKKTFDPFKEMHRAYVDSMYDPARNMQTDGEWIFHQVRLGMLREQPWFIKWFVPFDIRIKMAFDKANIIIKQYRKDVVERSVVFREKHADGSLERMRSGD